ncbi:MAG: M20/M25/M40 family metallo-hydrolase [Desulfovibrio sp.]|jgi:succinyl-diaminopimelate desuccinylase|nr:M20/M25/M40 family metallo-hydrolase [Desulfovibrio sp.]
MSRTVPDVVELAQRLVRRDTVAGNAERDLLEEAADLLREAGFSCLLEGYDPAFPHKANLYARLCPEAPGESLFFGGHVDTVSFGDALWDRDPLSGLTEGGLLHGRGSCDMKGGVAAVLCAAMNLAPRLTGRDLVLHLYGSEELGCLGSFFAARRHREHFGRPGAAIIAEPTGNRPLAGHKGVLWLTLECEGKAAHGAMPEKGDNALAKLLPAACRLLAVRPDAAHPVLGASTLALTSLHAGLNHNSIPDRAALTLDMRTVPGQDHAFLRQELAALAGEDVSLRTVLDVPPVWTDPNIPWCASTRRLLADFLGSEPEVAGAPYFTDAAAARSALPGLPLLILGPGETAAAHTTNESCPLDQLRAARDIYEALIRAWYAI